MKSTEAVDYLRELGKQYKEVTENGKWNEKRALWTKKNALIKTRPLILCTLPTEAWEEIISPDDCLVEDDFLKQYELFLRRQLYRAEHFLDDEIPEPILYSPLHYAFSDWYEGRQRPYSGNRNKAACFHPVIEDYSDIKKLRKPELIMLDEKKAKEDYEYLQDIFEGILTIKEGAPTTSDTDSYVKGWGYSAIDVLCELRGLQNIFMDMALEPDFVHEAMSFITDGIMDYKKTIRENNLLRLNNISYVMGANTPLGSNGLSLSDQLPHDGYNQNEVEYKDLWGYTMAQEFSEVSPQMHAEFVLPYQKKLVEDFGLLSYGCCEPNDRKWDNITNTFSNNLRGLSVSHVANLDIAAEKLKDNYVFSWKPHCSVIATFNEDEIYKQLSDGFAKTKECHLVCCLRDNLTLFGEPRRASRWTEIAMELAREYE